MYSLLNCNKRCAGNGAVLCFGQYFLTEPQGYMEKEIRDTNIQGMFIVTLY